MAYDITQQHLTIPVAADDSLLDAYMARPAGPGRFPAVIVGMELYGVNEDIRDITDRVARLGYVAIAPNFYHRTLPGAALPYGAAGRDQGFVHLHQLRRETTLADVRAVLDFLHADPAIAARCGFLGFSMGGHIAYLAATQCDIAACACFYGGWLVNTTSRSASRKPPPA